MPEDAATLNCLMCGAPTRSDASQCEHCGARLATASCPACFGKIFQGSTFCPLCGARADRSAAADSGLNCPHCAEELATVAIGKSLLSECARCAGMWVDKVSFDQVCADREEQAVALGNAQTVAPGANTLPIRYVRCPQCSDLMHRVNFGGSSGVILDICKPHGVWLDADELQRIIFFIRSGGIDRAREKAISELRTERRRLESAAREKPDRDLYRTHYPTNDLTSAVFSVGRALWRLF